jgi:hypothetical protein
MYFDLFLFLFLIIYKYHENRYWHRSLNVKKLLAVKFSHLGRNMTLQRMQKLYRLPEVRIFYLIEQEN